MGPSGGGRESIEGSIVLIRPMLKGLAWLACLLTVFCRPDLGQFWSA